MIRPVYNYLVCVCARAFDSGGTQGIFVVLPRDRSIDTGSIRFANASV